MKHGHLGSFVFDINLMNEDSDQNLFVVLFTDNETNFKRLYGFQNETPLRRSLTFE